MGMRALVAGSAVLMAGIVACSSAGAATAAPPPRRQPEGQGRGVRVGHREGHDRRVGHSRHRDRRPVHRALRPPGARRPALGRHRQGPQRPQRRARGLRLRPGDRGLLRLQRLQALRLGQHRQGDHHGRAAALAPGDEDAALLVGEERGDPDDHAVRQRRGDRPVGRGRDGEPPALPQPGGDGRDPARPGRRVGAHPGHRARRAAAAEAADRAQLGPRRLLALLPARPDGPGDELGVVGRHRRDAVRRHLAREERMAAGCHRMAPQQHRHVLRARPELHDRGAVGQHRHERRRAVRDQHDRGRGPAHTARPEQRPADRILDGRGEAGGRA